MNTNKHRTHWIRRVAENPLLNLIVGMFLLLSGLLESLDAFLGEAFQSPIGVHHGAVLLGEEAAKQLDFLVLRTRHEDDHRRPARTGKSQAHRPARN